MEHHITQVPASQVSHSTASHFKSNEGMGGGGGALPKRNHRISLLSPHSSEFYFHWTSVPTLKAHFLSVSSEDVAH
jgi:hypothetical protein